MNSLIVMWDFNKIRHRNFNSFHGPVKHIKIQCQHQKERIKTNKEQNALSVGYDVRQTARETKMRELLTTIKPHPFLLSFQFSVDSTAPIHRNVGFRYKIYFLKRKS
jgi:hypothetical protein